MENHDTREITLAGTGLEESIDLVAVLEAAGGVGYVWNRHSIAAGLRPPYQIDEGEFSIDVLVRAAGGVRASERVWVVCADPPWVGKASETAPAWERIEKREVHRRVLEELVQIIEDGKAVRGNAFTGVHQGADSVWTEKTSEFLRAVFGDTERQRFQSRGDPAPATLEEQMDRRISGLESLRNRSDDWTIELSRDELDQAIAKRRHYSAAELIAIADSPLYPQEAD